MTSGASGDSRGTEIDDRERLRLLYDLGCAFSARLELDELVPLVMAKCREALEAEGVAVLLLDEQENELYFPYVAEHDPDVIPKLVGLRFAAGRGLAGVALATGRPLRVDDAQGDARFYGDIDHRTGMTTRSLIAVPLVARRGMIGVIQAVNRRGGMPFRDEDLSLLEALAGSVAIAIENAELYTQVRNSAERLRTQVGMLKRDLARRDCFAEIVGTGAAMAQVFRLMESAAASPIAVLIEGETGTGKELVASGIHRASARADEPFLAVNCAALTESLLESELFGHRRGSFTGAFQDRRGLFEMATGGTLFLDEVGDMSPAMQAKLLRVLQEGEVIPVGDARARKVDVRAISATNRDLRAEVEARRFREDLYYRLGAFPIHLPPLRERREDIPILVNAFVVSSSTRHRKRISGIEPDALDLCVRFEWPGNIRELQNEVERAVALTPDGGVIERSHLSSKLLSASSGLRDGSLLPAEDPTESTADEPLHVARERFEAAFTEKVLRRHRGNISQAAKALGMSRAMLHRKLKKYGLRKL